MSQAAALRKAINEREIPHAFFEEQMAELHLRIQDALEGNTPSFSMVVGPSRVGKSMLAKALARNFPECTRDGFRQVPVLYVRTPDAASPRAMPRSVLLALNAPVPASMASTALMFERMARQLKMAGTRVILLDEASQLVDSGTRMPPRAAGDWFKRILDALEISVVVFGIPRLELLLKSNEQLRYRSGAVLRFNPYSWESDFERRQFVSCTKTYVKMFAEAGSHFLFDVESLLRNLYLLSGGAIGCVFKFMDRLALNIKSRDDRDISFADCAKTVSCLELVCSADDPAFSNTEVPKVKLLAAYRFLMDEAAVTHREVRGSKQK